MAVCDKFDKLAVELLHLGLLWSFAYLGRNLRTLDEVVASYCSLNCLLAGDSMAEDRGDEPRCEFNGFQSAVQWSRV
ncbi:hypothetical protein K443DRAFT_674404 [Laccaria amethystina LaAM-08-1]|jgi:hypothetical protein|uniref:Uncharacterized protein n=1 Tax=Laccaria amethystina LaAM-08-1 TaxID=1095629 RepID=A0A0C9Y8B0_9AGAR|nr:hypothetical protein K443DRAFT_674404 [Laccaria amethystina LaAM-08-1]